MKKNYMCKVRKSGIVYDNFASAVEDCVKDLHTYTFDDNRVSKPIVVKIDGGYQVMITDIHGNVYKRGVDVFIPKHLTDDMNHYVDEVRDRVCYCDEEDYDEDYEEDCDEDYEDEEIDEEDEEDEDEVMRYCEQCGNKYKLTDLMDIDGTEMCKKCALDYIETEY